jgi:hypothetical protein
MVKKFNHNNAAAEAVSFKVESFQLMPPAPVIIDVVSP